MFVLHKQEGEEACLWMFIPELHRILYEMLLLGFSSGADACILCCGITHLQLDMPSIIQILTNQALGTLRTRYATRLKQLWILTASFLQWRKTPLIIYTVNKTVIQWTMTFVEWLAFHSQLTLQLRTPDAIKHVQNRSLITALNKEEFKYRIISQNRWNPKYLGCELCVHWQWTHRLRSSHWWGLHMAYAQKCIPCLEQGGKQLRELTVFLNTDTHAHSVSC